MYHIATNGEPAECRATTRACPLGGEHFESQAAANEAVRKAGQQADIMRRPTEMDDDAWEAFDYELGDGGVSLDEYKTYLEEIDSTMQAEWDKTPGDGNRKAFTMADDAFKHIRQKEKMRVAEPLAEALLAPYYNVFEAVLHREELAAILADEERHLVPNGFLLRYTRDTPQERAAELMAYKPIERLVKAFMWDKQQEEQARAEAEREQHRDLTVAELKDDATDLLAWAQSTASYVSEDDENFVQLFLKDEYGEEEEELKDVQGVLEHWRSRRAVEN